MTRIPVVVDTQFQIPFLAGVYLAVNAVPGVRIIVDGPMCAFYKAEFIQGNHQLVADLQRLASPHRVLHTELDLHRAMIADERLFAEKIRQAAEDPETQALMFTALSSALLIGRDMERLMDAHRDTVRVPLVPVTSRALSGDWLDGWNNTLAALADKVPLEPRGSADGDGRPRVGIVGNLFLRHEGDSRGDAQELVRLVEALGARLESTWLSGQSFNELGAIGRADLLVALPYGEAAAERLGARMGVPVLTAPLPLSWTGTERFLDAVAGALDRRDAARAFLAAERDRWAAELLFRAERLLEGTRWMVVTDPVQAEGWQEIARDLGVEVAVLGLTTGARRAAELAPDGTRTLQEVARVLGGQQIHGIIGNSVAITRSQGLGSQSWARVEVGYPCFGRHPVVPVPSFGVVGEVAIAEMMCEALSRIRDLAGE